MNEQMTRGVVPGTAIVPAQVGTVEDVKEGVKQALGTNSPNQYAMTFTGEVNGKKTVSPYVKKAGRSVVLNDVAKKKGGLALMRSTCVRASWETAAQLQTMFQALSPEMQKQFIESRGSDFRAFTLPDRRALYLYTIIFGSGEKWQGEGIASLETVKMSSLHVYFDELAITRAFNRTVGRGTADGFIDPEQAAGSDDTAEEEILAHAAGSEAETIEVAGNEVSPAGEDPFRTPGAGGTGGVGASQTGGTVPSGQAAAAPGNSSGTADEPFFAASADGDGHHEPDSRTNVQPDLPEDINITDLTAMARKRNVFLKTLAKEQFGHYILGRLTAEQRVQLYVILTTEYSAEAGA